MMVTLRADDIGEAERRDAVFGGSVLLLAETKASRNLVAHARRLVEEAFAPLDPELAQLDLDVHDFIEIVRTLKGRFTNGDDTKQLVVDLLTERGVDRADTFFDVPRLRVVPFGGYLEAGVSYAYQPHRDTWYASPTAQVNWWTPVFPITAERTVAFYPAYWGRPISNSSSEFDYGTWTSIARDAAPAQVERDVRPHPLPIEAVDPSSELRMVLPPAAMLVFSACHLHATVPNTSDRARFSIDFRELSRSDVFCGRGGLEVDAAATGTTIGDFLRVADLQAADTEMVRGAR